MLIRTLTYTKAGKKGLHLVGESIRKKITTEIGSIWDLGKVYG